MLLSKVTNKKVYQSAIYIKKKMRKSIFLYGSEEYSNSMQIPT